MSFQNTEVSNTENIGKLRNIALQCTATLPLLCFLPVPLRPAIISDNVLKALYGSTDGKYSYDVIHTIWFSVWFSTGRFFERLND